MAQVSLQIKLDLPALRAEVNNAVSEILTKLSAAGVVKVHADTSAASAGVKKVGADIETVTEKAHGTREAFAQWGMILTGIGAAVNMVKNVLDTAAKPIEIAGQFEQYEVSLKVMLGSTEAAKARLEELVKFAAETPFTLPQVVEAGNQLQALGRFSVETLTDLGDLASAAGKPFEQVLSAYSKMMSGQKGIAIDMFRDLLITSDDWAKATGKKIGKNGELQASVDEMASALPKIIKEKGFSGMMAEQSKTLNGMISNFEDAASKSLSAIGDQILPEAKRLFGALTPQIEALGKHSGDIKPLVNVLSALVDTTIYVIQNLSSMLGPLAALTAAVIVYTNAAKVQVVAESISAAAFGKSAIAMAAKNISTNISTQATDLAAASQLAWNLLIDITTGKITLATAATELYTLTVMSLTAVISILSVALTALGAVWMIYELTVGASRREMAQHVYETEKARLGLKDLQSTLDAMSFDQLTQSITENEFQLAALQHRLQSLKEQTGTGVAWLDWIGTLGSTDKIYNQISAAEALIKARKELVEGQKKEKEKIEEASTYTQNLTAANLKELKSLNQVEEAIRKVTLARKFAESDEERKNAAEWLAKLEALQKQFTHADVNNDKNAAEEKKRLAEDLADARVRIMKEGKEKELAELDAWLIKEVNKHEGNLLWQNAVTETYRQKKNQIVEKYDQLEQQQKLELQHGYLELETDSLKKRLALINNEFDQKVLKAKDSAEQLKLIEAGRLAAIKTAEQNYNNEQLKMTQDRLAKTLEMEKIAAEHKIASMQPGLEKEKLQRQIQMNYELDQVEQQAIKEIGLQNMTGIQGVIAMQYYLAKQQEIRDKYAADTTQKTLQQTQELTSVYESHFGALISMAENAKTKEMSFANQLRVYLIRQLEQYIARFIATKAAEATIHSATETEKTTATELGVTARIALMGLEIVKELAVAAASILTAIAEGIASLFATFGPLAIPMIAGIAAGTVAAWNGVKSMLGFKTGGHTGYGNDDEEAGPVHKNEFVFESSLVKGNENKFAQLRAMLRSGFSLSELLNKLNPVKLIPDSIMRTNLSSPALAFAGSGMQSQQTTSLINEVKSLLVELKTKGIKSEVELKATKIEDRMKGADIYRSYEIQKKTEDKRKA